MNRMNLTIHKLDFPNVEIVAYKGNSNIKYYWALLGPDLFYNAYYTQFCCLNRI
jgi:hypothetical protein